jgi:hypothetical protein
MSEREAIYNAYSYLDSPLKVLSESFYYYEFNCIKHARTHNFKYRFFITVSKVRITPKKDPITHEARYHPWCRLRLLFSAADRE